MNRGGGLRVRYRSATFHIERSGSPVCWAMMRHTSYHSHDTCLAVVSAECSEGDSTHSHRDIVQDPRSHQHGGGALVLDDAKPAKLSHKCQALRSRASLKRITAALKSRPDLTNSVEQHLIDLGAYEALQAGQEQSKTPAKRDTRTIADKHIVSYKDLAVKDLVDILSALEPVPFSKAKLNQVVRTGNRRENQGRLCAVLEFVSNVVATRNLHSKSMDDLIDHLWARSNAMCRRGRELSIPVDWEAHGLFEWFCQESGRIVVTFRFSDPPSHATLQAPKNATNFVIEHNWSLTGAVIKQTEPRVAFQRALASVLELSPDGCDAALQAATSTASNPRKPIL